MQIIEDQVPLEELAERLRKGGGQPTQLEVEEAERERRMEEMHRHPYRGGWGTAQGV